MYEKPPLDHADLLARMRDRGLEIPDPERALRYLRQVGYYRLTPYMIPFQAGPGDHTFRSGVSFDDVLSLYVFDRHLRLLVMDALERIEVAVRARLTDHMTISTGDSHWYLTPQHFTDAGAHREFIRLVRTSVNDHLRRSPEEPGDRLTYPSALEHYVTHYGSPELPPSWVMFEELTLGQLNHLIQNLANKADRTAIAEGLGINDALLRSWLRSYQRVRNICAHHGRLWNRGLGVYPAIPTSSRVAWLENGAVFNDEAVGFRRRRLYTVLVSMQSILATISPHSSWGSRLASLLQRNPRVPLSAMGMPSSWAEDPLWQRSRPLLPGDLRQSADG